MISNAIHRCLGAVLAFFKAERCPRIDPSEIWELREIAARARGGLEALSSLENWPKIGTPFHRTRFSIGLPPLWLRLIEARHGVEERKGERTGATPPFWGCLRVRTHFSFHMCGCGHGDTPVGVAPLSFIPAGRLGLGPDNRKRSQIKSPHIASVVGRRKPVDRAGDVGRNRGSSSTVRTGEIGFYFTVKTGERSGGGRGGSARRRAADWT